MPVTSPDSIYFSDTTTTMDPNAISAAQATSVQAALALRQRFEFVWANAAARTSQAGMAAGSTGYQIDTRSEYIYESSIWRLKTPHAEYTIAPVSVPNNTFTLQGALTLVAAASTSSTFAVPNGNSSFRIVDPGIYAISVLVYMGANYTQLMFIELSTTSTSSPANRVMRGDMVPSEDSFYLSMPNLYVATANTNYYFLMYQLTGGTITPSSIKFRVTRIG